MLNWAEDSALQEDVQRESWASVLGRSIVSSENKKVLEVILEKDSKGAFTLSETDCARFLQKLGLDTNTGRQVEGIQICPNGRGVIYITLKDQIDLAEFYRYDVIDVTATGIRSVLVKSAGKREVVITIKGLHPNTHDDIVFNYLEKFGRIVSKRVIHGIFLDGPLKGLKNGDRCFKLELEPGLNLGSYHVLDGQKVTVKYLGQQQTCGRCLQTSRTCKGRGVARRCEAEGGTKADFASYIINLWREIGYSPEGANRELYDDEEDTSATQQIGGTFTPVKCSSSPSKFAGISIKRIPKDVDHGDVLEFIIASGLPPDKKDIVKFSSNGTVSIRGLENELCLNLIKNIHGSRQFSRTVYCNGMIPMTPNKDNVSDQ